MKHSAEELRWALKASKALDDNAGVALTDLCRMTGASRAETSLCAMKFGLLCIHSAMDMLVLSNVLSKVGRGEVFGEAEDANKPAF